MFLKGYFINIFIVAGTDSTIQYVSRILLLQPGAVILHSRQHSQQLVPFFQFHVHYRSLVSLVTLTDFYILD